MLTVNLTSIIGDIKLQNCSNDAYINQIQRVINSIKRREIDTRHILTGPNSVLVFNLELGDVGEGTVSHIVTMRGSSLGEWVELSGSEVVSSLERIVEVCRNV